jgi:hypothetical protein
MQNKEATSMADFIQVHNMEKEGYHPRDAVEEFGEEPGRFAIRTRKRHKRENVLGNRVWVIVAERYSPRTYRLCYTFIAEGIDDDESPYCVYGHEGDSFDPEVYLTDLPWFRRLYDAQNNFSFGFSTIAPEFAKEFERLRRRHCR